MSERSEAQQPLFTWEAKSESWFCELGQFHLDNSSAQSRMVVTHAHKDHYGNAEDREIHATPETLALIRARMPAQAQKASSTTRRWVAHPYHKPFTLGDAQVTLLPAGHMLGSAQVLVQGPDGRNGLFTGDIMFSANPTCAPLSAPQVGIHQMVIESTFGGKLTHPDPKEELRRVLGNLRMPAMIGVYAAGKAQRVNALLSEVLPNLPVMVDPPIRQVHRVYEELGMKVGQYQLYSRSVAKRMSRPFVRLVPVHVLLEHARDEQYLKYLASGWDHRSGKRWLGDNLDLSDHASAQEILDYIQAVKPQEVIFWHGDSKTLVEACLAMGISARGITSH
jgi:putative mRNA 3-end processing factor